MTEIIDIVEPAIPGSKGDQGPAGEIVDATATALPTGADPTVTLGGTPSERTIEFGLPRGPKGDPGDGSVNSVNGDFGPDVILNAGDVGAIESVNGKSGTDVTINHTDVGAERQRLFNVFDFGAVGDGTANDQAALQGALDAAYAAGGGEVIVPAGHVYMIASQVIIRSNTILTMYGAELIKPAGASFPWFRNFQAGVDNFPEYSGNGNIIVRGGTLNGQAHTAPNPAGNCLCFEHAENIEVRDVTFRNANAGQNHALELNAIKGARIVNCRFFGFRSYGVANGEAIQLDVAAPGSGNCPPSDYTHCIDVLVDSCEMGPSAELPSHTALVGSHTAVSGGGYFNIRVVNNRAKCDGAHGIRGYGWHDSVIANNVVDGAKVIGICVESAGGEDGLLVEHNVIANNVVYMSEIGISVVGKSTKRALRAIVTGNIVHDSPDDGIRFVYASSSVIEGNVIKRSGGDGIQLADSNACVVNGNHVDESGREGILASPNVNDPMIINNRVIGSARDGIRCSSAVERPLISSNFISSSQGAAITITNAVNDATVFGNMLRGGSFSDSGVNTQTTSDNR